MKTERGNKKAKIVLKKSWSIQYLCGVDKANGD